MTMLDSRKQLIDIIMAVDELLQIIFLRCTDLISHNESKKVLLNEKN